MRFVTMDRKLFWTAILVLLVIILAAAWLISPGDYWTRVFGPEDPGEPDTVPVAAEEPKPSELQAPQPGPQVIVPSRTDFFVECRLEREMNRGRQVELLQSVAADAAAGEAQRAAAQERLLQLTRDLEREMGLEHILRAKGFRDAVVFFQDDLVTVIVPEPLSEEEAVDIIDLVARGAGTTAENVMVIEHAAETST
jgi:stage III sporulation protein AH